MSNTEIAQAISVSVDVNRALIDQEEIQHFLGNPYPKEDETIIPNSLLHKFLWLAHHALTEESKHLELQLSVQGLKVGYERKVLTANNSYIVESYFFADQDWRIDFEPSLKNQVQFLTQEEAEPVESLDQNHRLREYLINLTEACADELHRIYPKLKDCLEVHVYILTHIIQDSPNTPIPNKRPSINLAEEPSLEPEKAAPEAREPNLDFEDSEEMEGPLLQLDPGMEDSLLQLDSDIEIVLGAANCPGCKDGIIVYKRGKGKRNSAGICRAC